jgi:predicted DNA-binding transcriptional regulator AlpA
MKPRSSYLSIPEFCDQCGIKPNTLYKRIGANNWDGLPAPSWVDDHWCFHEADVRAWWAAVSDPIAVRERRDESTLARMDASRRRWAAAKSRRPEPGAALSRG